MELISIKNQLTFIMENILQIEMSHIDKYIELESWQLPVLQAEIEEAFPCRLRTTDLFGLPDLHSLATFIQERINRPAIMTVDPKFTISTNHTDSIPIIESYKTTIDPVHTELLKKLPCQQGTDRNLLYLSILLSSFAKYFGIQYVSVEVMLINKQSVQTVYLDNEETRIESKRISSMRSQLVVGDNRMYETKHLKIMKLAKGSSDIIPCYFASHLTNVSSLLEYFDFIIGVDDSGSSIRINILYNANRMRRLHMEALLDLFQSQLIQRAIE